MEWRAPKTWFECDDGYPTDESLERLEKCEFTPATARAFLTDDLPAIAGQIAYMQVWTEDARDDFDKPVVRVSYATGGWSGAEDLIDAMLSHFWIRYYHTMWKRGGLFVFELPPPPVPLKEME